MEILIIGVWLFCALLAWLIARSKGANEMEAAGLGLILGPLGVLLALTMKRRD